MLQAARKHQQTPSISKLVVPNEVPTEAIPHLRHRPGRRYFRLRLRLFCESDPLRAGGHRHSGTALT